MILILFFVPFYFVFGQTREAPTSSDATQSTPSITEQKVDSVPNPSPSTTSTVSEVRTTTTVPSITKQAIPKITPQDSPLNLLPLATPEITAISTKNNFTIIAIISIATLALLGMLGIKLTKKLKNNNDKDQDGCNDIKQLLQQKKKELEDMIRDWPKEKVEEMAKNKVLKELKKDENFKEALEIKEGVEAKYNKLKDTIELLQKKYDLCILELPLRKKDKVILVDALHTFIIKNDGVFGVNKEMFNLLENYSNRKIILTNANDEEITKFNLVNLPYELFTLKHKPDKTNPEYYKKVFDYFKLNKNNVIYFEHRTDAIESARSLGIVTFHYNNDKNDLDGLKQFLDKNLS